MTVTLKQLETFVWVADLGSFRRAAERLNTTQPNVSSRIAGLEQALGQRLLDRDAGSVKLTAAGQDILAHARIVLRSVEDLVTAAGDVGLVQGVLRLGVTEMIAHTWLRDVLVAYKRAFPNVLLELTVDRSSNLSDGLFDRSLDLALQSGPFERQITGVVPLGLYPLIWVAAPGAMPVGRLTLDQILSQPILTHARGTYPYDQLAAHIARNKKGDARLVTSSNLSACIQMAVDGLGSACLPAGMVRTELAQGQLVRLTYDWTPDQLDFSARYDAERAPVFVAQAADLARQMADDFVQAGDP